MAPKSEKPVLAGRRGRRIAQALITLLAAGFIGLSTVEIARQVFGYSTTYPEVSQTCAHELEWFEEGIDRGEARALREKTPGRSEESLEDSVQMQLDTVEKKCSSPEDYEAFVAARRLREAVVAQIDGDYANLSRLRRAVDIRRLGR